MTPEAQRLAIAEACGWRSGACPCGGEDCGGMEVPTGGDWDFPPNYLIDLNAMHEAEGTLDWDEQASTQADEYRMALTTVCGHDRDLIHVATAAKRAEAFLKTIGKWEDET